MAETWCPPHTHTQVVREITEYARCNGMLLDSSGKPVGANTCHVPFHFCAEEERPDSTAAAAPGTHSRKKGGKR